MTYFALFYLENYYYLPHFEPIIEELKNRDISYSIVIPENKSRDSVDQYNTKIIYCKDKGYNFLSYSDSSLECIYLFFGNSFQNLNINYQRTVSVFHGCWGGKKVYLKESLTNFDIRFVESTFIKNNIGKIYPHYLNNMVTVGYTKLDQVTKIENIQKIEYLKKFKLDPNKKTILYAPTFYPSSILKIHDNFPEEMKDFNIIVKPHFFIYIRDKYKQELDKIKKWNKYSNVYFANFNETSLAPFMHTADILISDLSGAIYEFAALNKPVIINRFVYTRWYYKVLKYKLKSRLDVDNFHLWEVGDNAFNYKEMIKYTKENLCNPVKKEKIRNELVNLVVGDLDNKASKRIIDYLIDKR